MFIRHKQENGRDKVSIYTPSGVELLRGNWEIVGEPLESATDALAAGYEKAWEEAAHFGAEYVWLHSSVEGALDLFERVYLKGGEEGNGTQK